MCLTAICHLRFGQNDLDLLRAIAVTRVGRIPKLESAQIDWPENKTLPPLLPGLRLRSFDPFNVNHFSISSLALFQGNN